KLAGWARARWARHLAAKLRGSEDVDPPRPAQAEPTQSVRSVESTTEEDTGTISAFDIGANEVAEIVPIASRPLTPGEIESLLANFPTETAQSRVLDEMDAPAPARAIDETESLSAHVDALLAEAAPWDVIAPLEDLPVAAAANEAVHPEAPSIPALSDWQLVDDPVPVV